MANDGRVNSGTLKNSTFYVNWQLAGQNINENYTDINWQAGLNVSNSNKWYNNAIRINYVSINGGNVFGGGTYSNITTNGDHQLTSGSTRVYHNGDGTKIFNISISGWLYSYGDTSGGGDFELPRIPRQANCTDATNFNDEQNPTIYFNNAGGFSLKAKIEVTDNVELISRDNIPNTGNYTFLLSEAERNLLRAKCSNSNSLWVRFTIITKLNGVETWFSYVDRTMSIVNGNPTFNTFTYKDTNNSIVAITGSDQYLVKGKSTVRAIVSTTNKMIANKKATAKNYSMDIDTRSGSTNYSSTAEVFVDLGTIINAGTKRLNVRAYDSRNNSTIKYKDITIYDYNAPVVTASISRLNDFENQTTLKVNATYSRLTINNVDKNTVTATGGIQYRYRITGGTWGAWTNIISTVTAGKITCTNVVLSLDNTKSYEFEVKVADKLSTTTKLLIVDVGQAIFFISDNKKACYINGQEILTYDVVDTW